MSRDSAVHFYPLQRETILKNALLTILALMIQAGTCRGEELTTNQEDEKGAWKSTLKTRTPGFDQAGKRITGVDKVFSTKMFEGNVWGLQWNNSDVSPNGVFPQYCKHVGDQRVAVSTAEVPVETGLLSKEFKLAVPGKPYTSPTVGAWRNPGPVRGPLRVNLADGSMVTYCWYRFVDQPSLQQYLPFRRCAFHFLRISFPAGRFGALRLIT